MSSRTDKLIEGGLIRPPSFVKNAVQYEVLTGSVAYGCSGDTSDMDIIGFCIPPKTIVFPHLAGEIYGFDKQDTKFEQFQSHHVVDASASKTYDISIYGIVRFFRLVMENNPNMIDTLYVPQRCVLHCTRVGQMVRDNRHLFLHAGAYHKFRGYAYGQMHKIKTKKPEGKRKAIVEEFGYDVKFAYHVVRLLNEAQQILETGTIDLERDREILKSIRRGEWPLEKIFEYFDKMETILADLYGAAKLQKYPDEKAIKNLLLTCLEEHYGSLSGAVERQPDANLILRDLEALMAKYRPN